MVLHVLYGRCRSQVRVVSNPRLRAFRHGFKLGAVESSFTGESVEKCNADADFRAGYDAACNAKLDALVAFMTAIENDSETPTP